ncbi:MAG: nucleotidyltransferase domain-containing protein [Candidatus Woesearchaeota archaeon]
MISDCGIINGFEFVRCCTIKIREDICRIATECERKVGKLDGIAVFFFGSLARQEMIPESDLDILIIRKKDTPQYFAFRKEFIKQVSALNFCKVDIPEWGTLKDCRIAISKSITEGNQVAESLFVYGDLSIHDAVEKLKKAHNTVERRERVICFQKLYFDQYYAQKTRPNGVMNVKYCHGGTRDFLFPYWFALLKSYDFPSEESSVENSILFLLKKRIIPITMCARYYKSAEFLILLRNAILALNRGTSDEGLTYLDEATFHKIHAAHVFPKLKTIDVLKKECMRQVHNNKLLKDLVWKLFLNHLKTARGSSWFKKFNIFLKGKIKSMRQLPRKDVLLQVALIWGLSKRHRLFSEIFRKLSSSKNWDVLCSLCCHKDCPPEILDKIGRGQGCVKGYEYVLKIIGRNKNTPFKTLQAIARNNGLEERYRMVAETACSAGVIKANEMP